MLPRRPSFVERLLGSAVLLFAAALLVRGAIDVLMSVIWPLIGIGAAGLLVVIIWRLWQARRNYW